MRVQASARVRERGIGKRRLWQGEEFDLVAFKTLVARKNIKGRRVVLQAEL